MYDIKAISSLFDLRGDYVFGESYGSGHINDTYRVVVDQAGLRVSYILQRINSNVFKQPIPLMENVKRVTDEALRVLLAEGCKEAYRRTLTIVNAKDGKPYAQDDEGNVWRVYPFIDRARTYDMIENPGQCIEVARAFGNFQKLGANLPGAPLFIYVRSTTSFLLLWNQRFLRRYRSVSSSVCICVRKRKCRLHTGLPPVLGYWRFATFTLRFCFSNEKLHSAKLLTGT